ncbi:TELO2-interacting protein 2 [Heliangelus exortis]|uniref:TELO2-interacting protein 2 n=1 Tax=Heliangelus exortis TaxID=472823 RepID=UPI003A907981
MAPAHFSACRSHSSFALNRKDQPRTPPSASSHCPAPHLEVRATRGRSPFLPPSAARRPAPSSPRTRGLLLLPFPAPHRRAFPAIPLLITHANLFTRRHAPSRRFTARRREALRHAALCGKWRRPGCGCRGSLPAERCWLQGESVREFKSVLKPREVLLRGGKRPWSAGEGDGAQRCGAGPESGGFGAAFPLPPGSAGPGNSPPAPESPFPGSRRRQRGAQGAERPGGGCGSPGALEGLSPAALGELAAELSGHAAPPRHEWGAGDPPGGDSACTATAERAAEVGGVFLHLLGKLEAAKAEESLGPRVVGPVLTRVRGHVYIFAVTHLVERPWTSRRSQSVAEEVLVLLVRAAGCGQWLNSAGAAGDLYTREPPLIQAVLLCLLDLVPVLERSQRLQKQSSPSAPCHEVLHLVLTHMEAEHLLALRRAYARTLPALVQRVGIQVARHLKRMERVILGYLEVWDGPEEEARLGILQTLQSTIKIAWPRMPCRLPVLLKALLKLIWDVHTDQGPTPELVKTSLLQEATQCLILLDQCSGGQVKVLLEGVYSSCEEPRVQECLRKVQENS